MLPFETSLVRNKKGKVTSVEFDFEDALRKIGKIKPEIDLADKKLVKLISFEGGYYEGQMKRKKFHNFGAYRLLNGDFYIGSFKHGLKHGLGLYKLGSIPHSLLPSS